MRREMIAFIGLAALLALACAGPQRSAPDGFATGAQGQDQEPKRGGIITVPNSDDPAGGWDPMRVGTINVGHALGPAKNTDWATEWLDR